jgi:phosphatidylglycerophosphate synthase
VISTTAIIERIKASPMAAPRAQRWQDLLSRRYETPGTALPTHWLSQRLGAVFAAAAFPAGISPNAVTLAGFACMLLGCALYWNPEPVAWVAAGIIWQIGFALDCADGQLARATGRTSKFGAWLDLACDHVREVAMPLTILYVLLQAGANEVAAFMGCLVLASGNLLFLQTASNLRSDSFGGLKLVSIRAVVRQVLRNGLDLPFYLVVLCILRGWAELLLLYIYLHGAGQGLRAIALGWARIRNEG